MHVFAYVHNTRMRSPARSGAGLLDGVNWATWPPISVVGSGITRGEDGTAYPTAVLDVSGRPDVADLARVHAIEGVGDITTHVSVLDGSALLTVTMTRPVSSCFSILFPLPESRPLLDHAAVVGNLLLATTVPSPDDANPLWLAIDIDGPRLAAVLQQTCLSGGGARDAVPRPVIDHGRRRSGGTTTSITPVATS